MKLFSFGRKKNREDLEQQARADLDSALANARPPADSERSWASSNSSWGSTPPAAEAASAPAPASGFEPQAAPATRRPWDSHEEEFEAEADLVDEEGTDDFEAIADEEFQAPTTAAASATQPVSPSEPAPQPAQAAATRRRAPASAAAATKPARATAKGATATASAKTAATRRKPPAAAPASGSRAKAPAAKKAAPATRRKPPAASASSVPPARKAAATRTRRPSGS